MTNPLVRVVLVSLIGLAACSDLTGPKAELSEAREKWESHRLRDYDYDFRRTCFCPREITLPVTIAVRAGVVTGARYIETGAEAPAENLQFYPTVDELFETIETAISRKPERLNVEYDRSTGHPTFIDIDYYEQAADDELILRAWELRPPMVMLDGAP